MKKRLQMKMFLCAIMVALIPISGCNKSKESAKSDPKASNSKEDLSNSAKSETASSDKIAGTEKSKATPSTSNQPPQKNEVLNVMGTVYQVNKMMIIISNIKSKKPDEKMDEVPLNVTMRISNKNPEKEMLYTSWTPLDSELNPEQSVSRIEDDKGNVYPILPAKKGHTYAGQTLEKKLKPGEAVKDLLLFTELKPDTKRIKLYLVGSQMTGNKDLVFNLQIP